MAIQGFIAGAAPGYSAAGLSNWWTHGWTDVRSRTGELGLIKFIEEILAKLQTFTVMWLTIRRWAVRVAGCP
ncbi:hypothetical protein [Mycobacterium paragordonae]|uniref:hypothetical protein n=1 Tax=Mycobacterium paragordonae TaxID=1389713 RepID=UPI0013C42925|nr:hypothetical protein [Mycobacterium paragordonae]